MKRLFLIGALATALAGGVTSSNRAQAKEPDMITLSGCVQGFTQGGYFLSDSLDKKNGKPKHYLLINDNEEVKEFTGKWVEVVGQPFPFGYGVSIKTSDNRTLKTGSVFGVDEVRVVRESCANSSQSSSVRQDNVVASR